MENWKIRGGAGDHDLADAYDDAVIVAAAALFLFPFPLETEEKAADGSTPESATKANPTRYRVTSVQGGVRTTGQTNFTTLIHGDYCDQVFINNKKAWDIKSDLTSRPLKEIPDADLLPSDCRFRIDRGMLIDEKNDEAETAKTLIEELQRHDYKLRESVPLEQ